MISRHATDDPLVAQVAWFARDSAKTCLALVLHQKVEGLLDSYTDLKNPDFARVAVGIGLWGKRIEHPAEVDAAVRDWLDVPGAALLDVVVDRNELVFPPKVEAKQVAGMALYSAKGILSGGSRAMGVIELIGDALKP